jgi:hypothetical protein
VTDDRPALEFNILSRLRDHRFTTMRDNNLRRVRELRRPFADYLHSMNEGEAAPGNP